MNNKIKLLIIFIYVVFLFLVHFVYGVEELPNNGARISSAQVIQTKTGTGPWDDNDEPGNDSSENNNIVRSFDQVTWTIENTMILNDTIADSYTGGRIYFEAKLPNEFTSETAKWDLDSMRWITNAKISNDGLKLTGYYQMNKENITVPGKQTFVLVLQIYGAKNGTEFSPDITVWLNGNNQDNYINVVPNSITISAVPKYNINLIRNTGLNKRTTIDYEERKITGRMYGYGLGLQLYNTDIEKGLRGIEYPSGDITFDIDMKMTRVSVNDKSLVEDITNDCLPIFWNWCLNGRNGIILDRPMYWSSYNSEGKLDSIPYGVILSGRNYNGVYNSGNAIFEQEGSTLHVTIKDYKFNGIFPFKSENNVIFTKNIGWFSSYYFEIFVPDSEESSLANYNYYFTVSNKNMNATSISGQNTKNQMVTSDDSTSLTYAKFNKGSYNHFIDFSQNDNPDIKKIISGGRSGDVVAMPGNRVSPNLNITIYSTNDEEYYGYSENLIFKFDADCYEPYSDKIVFYSTSEMQYKAYYLTKTDGSNWDSQVEMNKTNNLESFNVYKNKEDIPDNYLIIGILFESTGDGILKPMYSKIVPTLKIKEDTKVNNTYGMTMSTYIWTKDNKLDRNIYTVENSNITSWLDYPKPTWSTVGYNYIKTEYDSDGSIISGTHNGSYHWGQTILVLSAIEKVELEALDEKNNSKTNFDIGKNENVVVYRIKPIVTSENNDLIQNGLSICIKDILPQGLEYVYGSSNYGEPEILNNDDGTILIWHIYDCKIDEEIQPIYFSAYIDENSLNGTQYINEVEISAEDIKNSSKAYRTSKSTIQVINLSSHRLYKKMNTPVIEKNGEIHFTLSYKNNTDENIPDFQLLDILPYNGDTRGTNFTGTYTLDRIVVTQEDGSGNKLTNNNLQILYTNNENARNVTSKDENLGNDWNVVTSENIKQKATAIAVKGEVGAQGKVNVDVYLKTENNKGLDKYVNSATAQVYKATEEMTTSNVVSQVVERKIEGIAWEDVNSNGIKDEGENILPNIELTLTDNLGNQVTDVNGNIVGSVRTDDNGYYKFENLPKGIYYVKVSIPSEDYKLTEKEIGSNSEINSKFNVEAKETDEIIKLNSIDLPEITMSNVNVGFVKKATSIIVKHQTEEGVDLIEPEIINGRIDDEYKTQDRANEFNNYELKIKPDNANGNMEEEQIDVIYVYSLVKGKITITKVDKNDNTKVLGGAIFKVERLKENNTIDESFIAVEKTTGEDGIVEFTDLLVGKYRVTETKAPEGYELAKNPIEVEVTKENRNLEIKATDRLKLLLPRTGGKGAYIFITCGIILMCLVTLLNKVKPIKEK